MISFYLGWFDFYKGIGSMLEFIEKDRDFRICGERVGLELGIYSLIRFYFW